MKNMLNRLLKPVKIALTMVSPKLATKFIYFMVFRKRLNLKNPKTINEKVQFLKLYTYNNNQTVTNCIDKYRIREYLKQKELDRLNIKLYGVYDNAEEINWDELPDSFALKCNHGSGYNIMVTDKPKLDIEKTKKQLNKWLKEDYYKLNAEIQYKYIKRKIVIEEYLDGVETYKFYCFNGVPKVMYITSSEIIDGVYHKDSYFDYFDMDFNHLDYKLGIHPNCPGKLEKPNNFEEMKEISRQLSEDFPFVRVDLYLFKGNIYISELTFVPTGGFMTFQDSKILDEWGSWLDISKEIKNKNQK